MAWGKKMDSDKKLVEQTKGMKAVKMTGDKKAQKSRTDAALTQASEAGKEVKKTKKGVKEVVAKTKRGRQAQADREEINKHVARGSGTSPEHGVGRKGSKSVWG